MADAGGRPGGEWLLKARRRVEGDTQFFLLPYAGVGASLAAAASRFIDLPVTLYGVQLPARENRISEPPIASMDAVVAALLPVIEPLAQGDYILMGCSFGALIAWELAQRLQAKGLPPRALVVLACASPALGHYRTRLSELNDDDLLAALDRRFGGVPDAIKEHEELKRLFMPGLRADVTLLDTYSWHAGPKLRTRLLTIGGRDDGEVRPEDLRAWADLVEGPAEHAIVDGGHFVLRQKPQHVTELLNRQLGVLV